MWMEEIAGTGIIAVFAPLRAAVFAIAEPMVSAKSLLYSEIGFKLSQYFKPEVPKNFPIKEKRPESLRNGYYKIPHLFPIRDSGIPVIHPALMDRRAVLTAIPAVFASTILNRSEVMSAPAGAFHESG